MPIDPTTLHGPTPDQFREMHQLLGGKTDPARIPRPNERPPVYAIGRFVVVPAHGGPLAIPATDVRLVRDVHPDGIVRLWTDDGADYDMPPEVTLDTLLHAIAKAEGR